jgi:hypothetical protein
MAKHAKQGKGMTNPVTNPNSLCVFHEDTGLGALKELAHSYLTITKGHAGDGGTEGHLPELAIPCGGPQVYCPSHRDEWLGKIAEASIRRRAELYYQQLDALRSLRQQARKELAEGRKHKATKLLRQIPSIGPIRSVLLVALLQTPHRFRTKRQLWTYSGLALETRNTGKYRIEGGQLKRSKKVFAIRGSEQKL